MIAWWNEPDPDKPVTHPNDELDARTMRRQAAKAMEAKEWRTALDLPNRAKKEDPAGDEAPAVQNARKVAREELLVLGGLEGGESDEGWHSNDERANPCKEHVLLSSVC